MTDMWQSLMDVLDEMLAVYRSLLELGEEKRGLLVQAKAGALEELNRLEEALVIKGSELENRRARATAVIITTHGLSNVRPTLTGLMPLAEPAAAERLQIFSRDFGLVLKEISCINAINTKLIAQALAFVNYNLNLLTRSQAESTYAPAGAVFFQRPSSALLDRKV
jgi:flagellar biosynthesis/type III secretory pathway chaperone